MNTRMTVNDLGELKPCENCGKMTYWRAAIPLEMLGARLPAGFNASNRRWRLEIRGRVWTICEQCRYDEAPFRAY